MGITLLLLIIMVGGLAFALYATKRFGFVRKPGHGKLKILETRPLGGRQFLVVGKYGRDSFLLGVCPGRIEYLARLEEEETGPFEQMLKSETSDS